MITFCLHLPVFLIIALVAIFHSEALYSSVILLYAVPLILNLYHFEHLYEQDGGDQLGKIV
jgi:hypothetical protein